MCVSKEKHEICGYLQDRGVKRALIDGDMFYFEDNIIRDKNNGEVKNKKRR